MENDSICNSSSYPSKPSQLEKQLRKIKKNKLSIFYDNKRNGWHVYDKYNCVLISFDIDLEEAIYKV